MKIAHLLPHFLPHYQNPLVESNPDLDRACDQHRNPVNAPRERKDEEGHDEDRGGMVPARRVLPGRALRARDAGPGEVDRLRWRPKLPIASVVAVSTVQTSANPDLPAYESRT